MTDSTNKKSYAVIVVGSGINSLVCAALLAQKGKQVLVLERNDRAGGCIRTEELFPGFTHDVLSSWYPLFIGGAFPRSESGRTLEAWGSGVDLAAGVVERNRDLILGIKARIDNRTTRGTGILTSIVDGWSPHLGPNGRRPSGASSRTGAGVSACARTATGSITRVASSTWSRTRASGTTSP